MMILRFIASPWRPALGQVASSLPERFVQLFGHLHPRTNYVDLLQLRTNHRLTGKVEFAPVQDSAHSVETLAQVCLGRRSLLHPDSLLVMRHRLIVTFKFFESACETREDLRAISLRDTKRIRSA